MLFMVRKANELEPEFEVIHCMWKNKTNLGGFQVQNVFFLDCLAMIALDFFVRRHGCFKFGLFMLERSKNMC
jgi:hypothetical protein